MVHVDGRVRRSASSSRVAWLGTSSTPTVSAVSRIPMIMRSGLLASMPWRADPYPALSARYGPLSRDGRLRTVFARRSRQLGVSPEDQYALLEATGIDCAGAVQVLPAGPSPEQPSVRWLAQAELVKLIEELPRAPLGPNEDLRVRASLAGVQGKLPVVIEDGKTGLPGAGCRPRISSSRSGAPVQTTPNGMTWSPTKPFVCASARPCVERREKSPPPS